MNVKDIKKCSDLSGLDLDWSDDGVAIVGGFTRGAHRHCIKLSREDLTKLLQYARQLGYIEDSTNQQPRED